MLFTVAAVFAGCGKKPALVAPFATANSELGSSSQVVSKPKKTVSVQPTSVKKDGKGAPKAPTSKILPVQNIQQLPELQAGCEITSASIVLKYLGFPVTKTSLLPFLAKSNDFKTTGGKLYGPNPWKTFAGDPQSDRYGCYAPVISDAMNFYLLSAGSGRCAYDITGTPVDGLYSLLDNGIPSIVWVTTSMQEPTAGPAWYLTDTGKPFQWTLKEHAMVLIGYNGNKAVFSDPFDPKGTVSYDKSLFQQRYEQLGSQAIVVE